MPSWAIATAALILKTVACPTVQAPALAAAVTDKRSQGRCSPSISYQASGRVAAAVLMTRTGDRVIHTQRACISNGDAQQT
eukprot:1156980-Pelagomonas_calceolata.AAC.8